MVWKACGCAVEADTDERVVLLHDGVNLLLNAQVILLYPREATTLVCFSAVGEVSMSLLSRVVIEWASVT